MKYKFGVMSSVWTLEVADDDLVIAKIAMSLFVAKNIPIAVYEPKKFGFMPYDILSAYATEEYDKEAVRKAMDSIQEFK